MDDSLKNLYEKVYEGDKNKFFTFSTEDATQEVLNVLDWTGLRVLEIGCGTGRTANVLANAGVVHVLAMDYSENAIKTAKIENSHDKIDFRVGSFVDLKGTYDCIVMQEVIEHVDDLFSVLSLLKEHIHQAGHLIITCPSFLNLRGFVWMTLQILFDVPMSLSDKHFISPFDMEKWSDELNLSVKWKTFRHGQGHGEKMIVDMKKRLTNALRDAGLKNSKVDELLAWYKSASRYETNQIHNGAKALYHFRRL